MTKPTPEEQAKLMVGWDEAVAARTEAGYAKAAAIKAAGGLASHMTLRDHFAGQAFLAMPHIGNGSELQPYELAHDAYNMADAMLEARKTTGEGEA
jgi:hypothetical protein